MMADSIAHDRRIILDKVQIIAIYYMTGKHFKGQGVFTNSRVFFKLTFTLGKK